MSYEELIGRECFYFEGDDEVIVKSTVNESNVNWVSKNLGERVFLTENEAVNKLIELRAA